MAGCDKAGRNKKSPANTVYKNTNKLALNKKRNETRAKKQVASSASKWEKRIALGKPARGTARAARRAAAENMPGLSFPEKWTAFLAQEAARANAQG